MKWMMWEFAESKEDSRNQRDRLMRIEFTVMQGGTGVDD